jgi:hypothetical protein
VRPRFHATIRLAIIDDLASNPGSITSDVRRRVDKPWSTVDRQLESLHMLGVLKMTESPYGQKTRWLYSLADGIDPKAIDPNLHQIC